MNLCWEAMGGAPESCVRGSLTTTLFNLVSISHITNMNCGVNFYQKGITIMSPNNQNEIIMSGPKQNGLYILNITPIVMNIEWNYNYYQPWSVNKWLVDEMLAMCQKAKLRAEIKPTALCLAIDKENFIESLLDSVHYLYNRSNPNPVLSPALPYESTCSCTSIDITN